MSSSVLLCFSFVLVGICIDYFYATAVTVFCNTLQNSFAIRDWITVCSLCCNLFSMEFGDYRNYISGMEQKSFGKLSCIIRSSSTYFSHVRLFQIEQIWYILLRLTLTCSMCIMLHETFKIFLRLFKTVPYITAIPLIHSHLESTEL